MWTAAILIFTGLIGLFFYLKTTALIGRKNYQKRYRDILEAHRSIGYPALTEAQQFDILDNENTGCLSALTQYEFIPTGLLNHYLTIEPDRYFKHLLTMDLQNKMRFNPDDLTDGFYVNQAGAAFEYIFVERQNIVFRKRFETYEKLLKYLVFDRLKLHAPEKYKHLDKNYYA